MPNVISRLPAVTPAKPAPYDRCRDLPRLLPIWPPSRLDDTPVARRQLVASLRKALRTERSRGRAGHWAYDLARHHALARAFRAEVAAVRALSTADARALEAIGIPENLPPHVATGLREARHSAMVKTPSHAALD